MGRSSLILGALITVLSLLAIAFQMRVVLLQIQESGKEREAHAWLKKMGVISLNFFQDARPPTEMELWRELGLKESPKDPWGTPYLYEQGKGFLRWKSAGTDKVFGSSDDISQDFPLEERPTADFTNIELDRPTASPTQSAQ